MQRIELRPYREHPREATVKVRPPKRLTMFILANMALLLNLGMFIVTATVAPHAGCGPTSCYVESHGGGGKGLIW